MADAKISQILATLAQQGVRPNSAAPQMPPSMNMPYQGQQPGQMPMMPPSMPQQPVPNTYSPYPGMGGYGAPPAGMPQAGYGLPQPMSSGSMDLSSIRPMKSGTMDFGGSSSRGYKRSRSRSPDRHHRDSYRDDRRRDRSRSPDRGHRGGGDPNEQGTDTLDIPSGLVGLIIGRAGDNLRRVENESDTRVQFTPVAESRGPNRECKIRGTRLARDRARREIQRIIEDGGKGSELPPYGLIPKEQMGPGMVPLIPQPAQRRIIPGEGGTEENALQILVPNKTVGLIIGRGGETIRDLQEKSGCHVNITGEEQSRNGFRPVNLIGTPSAQAVAKDLILQVVDSDNKGAGASGANAIIASANVPAMQATGGGGGSISETIMVPSEAVGMIIGKGGETIKEMQNTTGCKINVSQPTGVDVKRSIALIGSSAAIERAKTAINEKVYAMEEKRGIRRQDNPNYTTPVVSAPTGTTAASSVQPGSYGGYQSSGYAQAQPGGGQSVGGQSAGGASAGGPDPYAAWGGYQNYVAAYYAMTQQQGQGQGPK